MNTADTKKRFYWSPIKRGWFALVICFALGAGILIADANFGPGYGVATAAVSVVIWFTLRPWRFGLLSPQERREVYLPGTVGICGFLLVEMIRHWKW